MIFSLLLALHAHADFARTVKCLEGGSSIPYVFSVASMSEARDFGKPAEAPPWNKLEPRKTVEYYSDGDHVSIQVGNGMAEDFLKIPADFFRAVLAAKTAEEYARIPEASGEVETLNWYDHGDWPGVSSVPLVCSVN